MRNITSEVFGARLIPEFNTQNIELIQVATIDRLAANTPETFISAILANQLNGKAEVPVNYGGRIDVLTESAVIECKSFSDWKAGLGQVLAYSYYHPKHEKWLALFSFNHYWALFTSGDNNPELVARLSEISAVCSSCRVKLKILSEESRIGF